ncbi:MAG: hypothetical protein H6855_01880 [Rhodospirillales bacterium]|nr:hypothetical protein [Rhodospirillales bacterium]MCB9964814.1 hypothetical protein [Rhodospirillales bacterium]MCB9980479.1 hypothetical protein [Rhodospirillales bacterium]
MPEPENMTEKKQNNHATFYVTNKGFLVPTLVSAWQVHQRHAALTDLFIFLVECDPALRERLEASFPQFRFIEVPGQEYIPAPEVYFVKNHVPVSTLARLVTEPLLPETYERVLYLDGDTQITGDMTPLLTCEVPEGKIAAGSGGYWLVRHPLSNPGVSNYFQYLKQDDPREYFNTGVMAATRQTWGEVSRAALSFFMKSAHPDMLNHDQSALNAVCVGKRLHLPPAYNFHRKYAELYLGKSYVPKIVHFTGMHKPWLYAKLPWSPNYVQPYLQLISAFPFLQETLAAAPAPQPAGGRYLLSCLKQVLGGQVDLKDLKKKREVFWDYVKTQDFLVE